MCVRRNKACKKKKIYIYIYIHTHTYIHTHIQGEKDWFWRLRSPIFCSLEHGLAGKPVVLCSSSWKAWGPEELMTVQGLEEMRCNDLTKAVRPEGTRSGNFLLFLSFLFYPGLWWNEWSSPTMVREIFITQFTSSNVNVFLPWTPSQTHQEIMFYQLPGHALFQSNWYLKTITVWLTRFLNYLSWNG